MLRSFIISLLILSIYLLACTGAGSDEQQEQQLDFLTAGDTAPDFTLRGTEIESEPVKKDFTLYEYAENGPVLLAFYPMAFTGG